MARHPDKPDLVDEIRERLKARGLKQGALARALGISPQGLSRALKGRRISRAWVPILHRQLGLPEDEAVLQGRYDFVWARRERRLANAQLPPQAAAEVAVRWRRRAHKVLDRGCQLAADFIGRLDGDWCFVSTTVTELPILFSNDVTDAYRDGRCDAIINGATFAVILPSADHIARLKDRYGRDSVCSHDDHVTGFQRFRTRLIARLQAPRPEGLGLAADAAVFHADTHFHVFFADGDIPASVGGSASLALRRNIAGDPARYTLIRTPEKGLRGLQLFSQLTRFADQMHHYALWFFNEERGKLQSPAGPDAGHRGLFVDALLRRLNNQADPPGELDYSV